MVEKERIVQLLFEVVDIINEDLPEDNQLQKSLDTSLGGADPQLDSLGFVNFMVTAEQKIEEEFDATVALATEEALSQEENNPFNTIQSLADYIAGLIEKAS